MAFGEHLAKSTSPRALLQDERKARETGAAPEAGPAKPLEVFIVKVGRVVFMNAESGFFIIQGTIPKGELPPKVMFKGRPYLGKTFTVAGQSKAFTEKDRVGQEIECYGSWVEDPKYGLQFDAKFINEKMPTSPEAIEAFLASGKIANLGPSLAKQIVGRFGAGTLEVFDKEPHRLLEIPGIGERRIDAIAEAWKSFRGVYEIMAFMQLHGIGDAVGSRIYNQFGENAIRVIEQNPYSLTRVPMVGFKTADRIAKNLGMHPQAPFRIQAALRFALEEAAKSDGHTALPIEDLVDQATNLLELDEPGPVAAQVRAAIESGGIIERRLPVKNVVREGWEERVVEAERACVSSRGMLMAEQKIAAELLRLARGEGGVGSGRADAMRAVAAACEGLDETQRRAARNSFGAKVSVITGGPGTGKTHTIKSIIAAAKALGASVALCAPTGRAAKRMEEATGERASTIHRLLGFAEGGFKKNEETPLEGDLFIVDEASMIDIWLGKAFLAAVPSKANVIFVGDVDQLPSVGAGNFLSDLIECGALPVSRLGRIHRQAAGSMIITNAHKIIHGQMPELCPLEGDRDFAFIDARGNRQIQEAIVALTQMLLGQGVDPNTIQLLSPQKGTEVGTAELNSALRPLLNVKARPSELAPAEEGARVRFARGDRVMQFRNNYEIDLFNGDVGVVDDLDEESGALMVDFDGRLVAIEGPHLKDIQLAYAITIHKSQGTEHAHVIIPMSRSHSFMMSSNLLYTAVTRGKQKVYLVGEGQVVGNTVRRQSKQVRHTGLRKEIAEAFGSRRGGVAERDWFGGAGEEPVAFG